MNILGQSKVKSFTRS